MNNKTKKNLKRAIAGGLMALTLTVLVPNVTAKATDGPIVWSIKKPQVTK
ncbi:hypothetical protein [Clostridium sp. CF012]|nr:hypothetical protein [Clostridium sp. CF012]MBU3145025.1 hypothetical protein [Clostridium sp. CF012]